MRVWLLQDSISAKLKDRPGYWNGQGLTFTTSADSAIQFARESDAMMALAGNPLLNAQAVPVEVTDESAR